MKKVRDLVIEKPESWCKNGVYWYSYCLNNPLKFTDPSGMPFDALDFDNNLFDISGKWGIDFDMNHPFDFGGGGAHPDRASGWNRDASTAGMLGIRVEGDNLIDNAIGVIIDKKRIKKIWALGTKAGQFVRFLH